ncbi:MAG TPA: hypothetical protein VHV08_13895 [Pirellulales bacterium]|nr:hypothetical protein [Pirellulales bacterium]
MTRLFAIVPLWFVWAMCWPCAAQDAALDLRRDRAPHVVATHEAAAAAMTPTPEMWFYEQERSRYDDPKMAIRRRAETRAQQRQDRMASMEWYGMSNSRPAVSITPLCGAYSAFWGSNSYDPLRWRSSASPLVIARPTNNGGN